MDGLIFSIKRYAIHDGPGIRVTIFMKGCPLSCWWCHNPEGISPLPEEVVQIDRIGDKEFFKKSEAGKTYSVNEIINVLDADRIFIEKSNGGVTFSGGEPLQQIDFLTEALKACKNSGYHTVVDTSGYSTQDNFLKIKPYTDLFLYDLKFIDNIRHLLYAGVSNDLILDNLRMLAASGKDIIVRIPVIPGINDDIDNLEEMKKILYGIKVSNLKKICLLPYHRIGASKYKRFNIPYKMINTDPPSKSRMYELKTFFEETGIKVKIGG